MVSAAPHQSKACGIFALRLLCLLCLLEAFSFSAVVAGPEDSSANCQDVTLPQDIRDTLQRRFAGWKIQLSRDLRPEARKVWAQTTPLACPGIASGHFADSRGITYALLLVPADSSVTGYELVAFSAPPKLTFYGYKLLGQAEVDTGSVFILSVPVERVLDRDARKQLRPKTDDAVSLVHVDGKDTFQNVFFWNGDSYGHTQLAF